MRTNRFVERTRVLGRIPLSSLILRHTFEPTFAFEKGKWMAAYVILIYYYALMCVRTYDFNTAQRWIRRRFVPFGKGRGPGPSAHDHRTTSGGWFAKIVKFSRRDGLGEKHSRTPLSSNSNAAKGVGRLVSWLADFPESLHSSRTIRMSRADETGLTGRQMVTK